MDVLARTRRALLSLDDITFVDAVDERDHLRDGSTTSTAVDAPVCGAKSTISIQRHDAYALDRGEVDAIAGFSACAVPLVPLFGFEVLDQDVARLRSHPDADA